MRILLRHTGTGLFFESEDKWTTEPEAARDFGSSGRAIVFVTEWGLGDVEILMAFDDPRYNITLPIRNRPVPPTSGR